MEFTTRQQNILAALIERYVQTAEPVSSHMILEDTGLNVSSATIRNELAELETAGYVMQPHTSAGRIPTDAGYRYYVNTLMRPHTLSRPEANRIQRQIQPLYSELEDILDEACHLLSNVTRYTSVILIPTMQRDSMKHLQMENLNPYRLLILMVTSSGQVEHRLYETDSKVPADRLNRISNYLNSKLAHKSLSAVKKLRFEDISNPTEFNDPFLKRAFEFLQQTIPDNPSERIVVEGIVYILQQPEFSDVEKARGVVEVLDEEVSISPMLNSMLDSPSPTVIIGEENRLAPMRVCSFIGMPYRLSDEAIGSIGVLGPTRMQYAETISAVNYLTKRLEECVSIVSEL